MLKKFPSDKTKGTKNALFFLSCALTYPGFTLRFWYDLNHKARLSKTVCGTFHIRFRFIFIKVYIFVQQNAWILWLQKVIIPFKIKIIHKPHTVLLPDLWFLNFEVLKFNHICVSWSFPKCDLVTNFLELENRSFENVSFSQ